MKTNLFLKILSYIGVAVVFFAIAWFVKGCGKTEPGTTTVIQKDTVRHIIYAPVEDPIPSSSVKPHIIIKHDTIRTEGNEIAWQQMYDLLSDEYTELYNMFMTLNKYDLKLLDDTSAMIQYEPSVRGNTLLKGGKLTFINRRSTVINSTTVSGCKTRFILGGGASYFFTKGISLHLSLGFTGGRHLAMTATGDPFARYVSVTGYYQFGKK